MIWRYNEVTKIADLIIVDDSIANVNILCCRYKSVIIFICSLLNDEKELFYMTCKQMFTQPLELHVQKWKHSYYFYKQKTINDIMPSCL